jgi:hypothetical protein
MVSTQQVQEKCGMRPNKEWLTGLTHRKLLHAYPKTYKYLRRLQHLKHRNIDHTIESTVGIDLTNSAK